MERAVRERLRALLGLHRHAALPHNVQVPRLRRDRARHQGAARRTQVIGTTPTTTALTTLHLPPSLALALLALSLYSLYSSICLHHGLILVRTVSSLPTVVEFLPTVVEFLLEFLSFSFNP